MKISAIVNPTENEARIVEAIKNIFPEIKGIRILVNKIYGVCDNPQTFKRKVLNRDILHILKSQFQKNLRNEKAIINLNKQAAVHAVLNIIEDEPTLGSIKVEITAEEFKRLFNLNDIT